MSDPIRILFVDDDEDELLLLEELLKEIRQSTYVITWISSFESAIREISSAEKLFDICLIDYRMGKHNGIDLLKEIRRINTDLPVIVFTGLGDSAIDLEAMNAGASDYLVKGSIDANLLERSIRYSVRQAETQMKLINQEKNLRESEKFAIAGRIALMIAHEVRNPLTNVKLALHQLRDEVSSNEVVRELFSIAERNSDRINELVKALLESTKFSDLQREPVDIRTLLEEALALAEDRIRLKNIRVVKHYSPQLPEITVDQEKIRTALLNIMINGLEALPETEGVLTVVTSRKENKCLISIHDNGAGISEENMNRIFEPYFSNKTNGTGLGLTVTQNIIYNHEGTIEVKSFPGKGTEFIISLDLK